MGIIGACLVIPLIYRRKNLQCDFVLYVGNKKLVKRKEFESYISKSLEI